MERPFSPKWDDHGRPVRGGDRAAPLPDSAAGKITEARRASRRDFWLRGLAGHNHHNGLDGECRSSGSPRRDAAARGHFGGDPDSDFT